MDCADIERALLKGERPSGPEVDAHVRGCASCQFLLAEGKRVAQALAASAEERPVAVGDLEQAVMEAVAGDRGALSAVRGLSQWVRLGLLAVVLAAVALFFFEVLRRSDFGQYPPLRMGLLLGAFAVTALAAGWAALQPLYRPPLPRWLTAGIVGVGVGLPVVAAFLPGLPTQPGSVPYVPAAFYCWATGLAVALVVFLALRALDRGGQRGSTPARLSALAAGVAGVLCLQLECAVNAPLHLLTGHAALPLLALGAVWAFRRM